MEVMNRSDLSQGSGCGSERLRGCHKIIDDEDLKNEHKWNKGGFSRMA